MKPFVEEHGNGMIHRVDAEEVLMRSGGGTSSTAGRLAKILLDKGVIDASEFLEAIGGQHPFRLPSEYDPEQ